MEVHCIKYDMQYAWIQAWQAGFALESVESVIKVFDLWWGAMQNDANNYLLFLVLPDLLNSKAERSFQEVMMMMSSLVNF